MTQELIPQAQFDKAPVSGSYFLTNSKLDKLTRNNVGTLNTHLQTLVHEKRDLTFDIEHQPKKHGVQINWKPL